MGAEKPVVIHGPHHGSDLRVPFQRSLQIFGELLVACAGKSFLHGVRAKERIHLAWLKVLRHGGPGDDGVKIKVPGNAVVGVAFFIQPVGQKGKRFVIMEIGIHHHDNESHKK